MHGGLIMRLFKSKDKTEQSALTTLLSVNKQEPDQPNPAQPESAAAPASAAPETVTAAATAAAPAPAPTPAADLPAAIDRLKGQLKGLATQYQGLRQELQTKMFAQRDVIKQTLREVSAREKRITVQLADIAQQQKDLQAQDDAALHSQLTDLAQAKDALQKQITNLEQQVTTLQKSVDDNDQAIKDNAAAQQKNRADNAKLAAEIKGEADLVAVVQIIEKNKDEVFALHTQAETLTKEAAQLQEKGTRLQDELANTQDGLTAANRKSTENDQQTRQIEQKLDQAKRDRHAQLNTLQTQEKAAKQQHQTIVAQFEARQRDLAAIQDDIQHIFNTDHLIRLFQLHDNHQYGVLASDFGAAQEQDMVAIFQYLEAHLKHPAILISYGYDPDLADHIQTWAAKHDLHTPTVYNLFTELQKSAPNTAQQMTIPDNDHWRSVWSDDRRTRDIYDHDQHLMHVTYRDADHINQIDYYSEEHLSKRSEFNEHGQLSRTTTFAKDGTMQQVDYYRIEGTLVLSFHYVDEKVDNIQMFDTNGLLYTVFNSTHDLAYWWLAAFWKQHPELFVIGDPSDPIFTRLAADYADQELPYFSQITTKPAPVKKALQDTPWTQLLVATMADQQALGKITNRDLSVDYIATGAADTLPEALTLAAPAQTKAAAQANE